MKKNSLKLLFLAIGIAVVLPMTASASALTMPQVNAIISLLQAFGVQQSVINEVYADLVPSTPTTATQSPTPQSPTPQTTSSTIVTAPTPVPVATTQPSQYQLQLTSELHQLGSCPLALECQIEANDAIYTAQEAVALGNMSPGEIQSEVAIVAGELHLLQGEAVGEEAGTGSSVVGGGKAAQLMPIINDLQQIQSILTLGN